METTISPFFMRHNIEATNLWKENWQDRDVIFVTGEGSRFNYNYELFDNIKKYENSLK